MSKKIKQIILRVSVVVCLIFFTTCRKEDKYIPGLLSCTVNDTTSFVTTYHLLNQLGFTCQGLYAGVGEFFYIADRGRDSMAFYLDTLSKKKYLGYNIGESHMYMVKNTFPEFSSRDSVITLDISFYNFSTNEVKDWFNFIKSPHIKIYETPFFLGTRLHNGPISPIKEGSFYVPVGTEDYWVKELKKIPFVMDAVRN